MGRRRLERSQLVRNLVVWDFLVRAQLVRDIVVRSVVVGVELVRVVVVRSVLVRPVVVWSILVGNLMVGRIVVRSVLVEWRQHCVGLGRPLELTPNDQRPPHDKPARCPSGRSMACESDSDIMPSRQASEPRVVRARRSTRVWNTCTCPGSRVTRRDRRNCNE